MDKILEKLTVETVMESASLKPGRMDHINADTRFHELGIDSITMLSILLKLESRLSASLDLIGDQLEAPGNMGELFTIVELLERTKSKTDVK